MLVTVSALAALVNVFADSAVDLINVVNFADNVDAFQTSCKY